MSIDFQAGARHCVKLLEDGAEVPTLLESLQHRPGGDFREGMRAVLENTELLEELEAIRSGKYNQQATKDFLPNADKTSAPALGPELPRQCRMSRTHNAYPGLRLEKGWWYTRRFLKGKEFRSPRFKHRHEAIAAWQKILEEMLADVATPPAQPKS